jgi:glutathione S-transferase
MRARLALLQTETPVELREILLKEKPQEMLDIAPKKRVPVLQLSEHEVLDESLDIMLWAVDQDGGINLNRPSEVELALIERNDKDFKHWLDRYKYHVGYPEQSPEYYRSKAMEFLSVLDTQLEIQGGAANLFQTGPFTDYAIFPFVRQFAFVDKDWFDQQDFEYLDIWLESWLQSDIFARCMQKFPLWQSGTAGVEFGAS